MWHAPLTVKAGNLPEETQISEKFSDDFLSQNTKIKIYEIINLSAGFYWPEGDWGRGVLRKIFWAKGGEATGDWRKLHNEELRDLC